MDFSYHISERALEGIYQILRNMHSLLFAAFDTYAFHFGEIRIFGLRIWKLRSVAQFGILQKGSIKAWMKTSKTPTEPTILVWEGNNFKEFLLWWFYIPWNEAGVPIG